VKILAGNNRQFDLIAFSVIEGKAFHVESSISITDSRALRPKDEQGVIETLKKKFYGDVPVREGKRTDYARGISYADKINEMYRTFGLDPKNIQRVACRWAFYSDNKSLDMFLNEQGILKLSFRDTILPELEQNLTTAHYEDDGMRTITLIREYRNQTISR
jgi:hypothetical protein